MVVKSFTDMKGFKSGERDLFGGMPLRGEGEGRTLLFADCGRFDSLIQPLRGGLAVEHEMQSWSGGCGGGGGVG